jgi:3-isopropylmalate dehydrogenase
MLLDHLGETAASQAIEAAVAKDLASRGASNRTTSEIGDSIAKAVA